MKNLLRLMALASAIFAAPVLAQVVTLPIINTPSGKTLAGGSVIIDSSGVEKGTTSNPFLTSASTSHTSYTLLNAATSTGAQSIAPDTYTLTFPTAFNGATISVTVTDPSGNVVTTAYTSAPTTPVAGYYGATSVTATASGGTPTGSLKLNGGPPASSSGGGGGGGGDASAANQTSVQANAGSNASKANAIQGITGGKPISASIDQTTPGTTDSVTPKATEVFLGFVGGFVSIAPASFTTPAGTTPYASGDLIANSATAGSVVPLTFTVACRINGAKAMVRRARFMTPDTGFAGATIYLKLYRDSPTVTNGDNGIWLTTESNYIGTISIIADQHFSDAEKGIGVPDKGSEINFSCAGGSTTIYGLEVVGGAVTPVGNKTHTDTLEILQN